MISINNGVTNSIPRVFETLKILKNLRVKAHSYLDLGCNDGQVTEKIARVVEAKEIYGIDIDSEALMYARSRGVITFRLDLSKDKLPFNDDSVDLITALEVIEYLLNPDNMLKECFRVLKHGGYLVISTPNLASWVNRIIFLMGYQPYNVEVSTEILAGVPLRANTFAKPGGRVRSFTLRALKELLIHHGFRIITVRGAPGVYPREITPIDKILSKKASLARRIIVAAMK